MKAKPKFMAAAKTPIPFATQGYCSVIPESDTMGIKSTQATQVVELGKEAEKEESEEDGMGSWPAM